MGTSRFPCPSCERLLSPDASTCPGCGHPLQAGWAEDLHSQQLTTALESSLDTDLFQQSAAPMRSRSNATKGTNSEVTFNRQYYFWTGLIFLSTVPLVWLVPYIGVICAILALLTSLTLLLGKERFLVTHFGPAPSFSKGPTLPCPTCSKGISEKARFCRNCGEPLVDDRAKRQKEILGRRHLRAGAIVLISFALVSSCVAYTPDQSYRRPRNESQRDELIRQQVEIILEESRKFKCRIDRENCNK